MTPAAQGAAGWDDPPDRALFYADLADAIEGRPIDFEPAIELPGWTHADAEARRRAIFEAERRAAERAGAALVLDRLGLTYQDVTRARIEAERDLRRWDAIAPARPSLDTGEQVGVSGIGSTDSAIAERPDVDVDRRQGRWIRRARIAARAVTNLRDYLARAARCVEPIRYTAGMVANPIPCRCTRCTAVLMSERLRACQDVRAIRDAACGAWTALARSCDVRGCPNCEPRRSRRLAARFDTVAAAAARPVFLTLTSISRPPGELAVGLAVQADAWDHLRDSALFAGGWCRSRYHGCEHPPHRRALSRDCRCARCVNCRRCHHRAVAGGVTAAETTRHPSSGAWHPHLHTLLDAPWLLQGEIRHEWRRATCAAARRALARGGGQGGRVPRCAHIERDPACSGAWIVDIRIVQGEPGSPARRAAIAEVLKYTLKAIPGAEPGSTEDPGDAGAAYAEFLSATRARRLVAGWGQWYALGDVESSDDDYDPADYLVGPEYVESPLRGLPRRCPACRMEAMWDPAARIVPRWQTTLAADGRSLAWRPPGPDPGPPTLDA